MAWREWGEERLVMATEKGSLAAAEISGYRYSFQTVMREARRAVYNPVD